MSERLEALIGRAAEGVWLGTFHALAARMLRRHAEAVGLKSSFTILDTDDQIRLLKQMLQAEDIDEKRWPARVLLAVIERWKDRGLAPTRCARPKPTALPTAGRSKLYQRYQERLATVNAFDFGDLLLHNLTIFTAPARGSGRISPALSLHPGGRVSGHQRRAVSVAAPAGPGAAQPVLRRRRRPVDLWLAGRRGRQHPALRKRFSRRHDHPPEENYRSTGHILGAASGLIAHNRGRLGKTLWTQADEGDKVVVARVVGRRGRGALGRRGDRGVAAQGPRAGRDRDPGARRIPDPRVRGALHRAGPALSRDRRPAVLRAPGNPRRARLSAAGQSAGRRPRLRAHPQHAAPRHRQCHPAAAPWSGARPAAAIGRGGAAADRRRPAATGRAQCAWPALSRRSTAGATRPGGSRIPIWCRSCSTNRAIPRCGRPKARPMPPAAWKT